jgi:hypothetical protein
VGAKHGFAAAANQQAAIFKGVQTFRFVAHSASYVHRGSMFSPLPNKPLPVNPSRGVLRIKRRGPCHKGVKGADLIRTSGTGRSHPSHASSDFSLGGLLITQRMYSDVKRPDRWDALDGGKIRQSRTISPRSAQTSLSAASTGLLRGSVPLLMVRRWRGRPLAPRGMCPSAIKILLTR